VSLFSPGHHLVAVPGDGWGAAVDARRELLALANDQIHLPL
jgi:hypothetical protein